MVYKKIATALLVFLLIGCGKDVSPAAPTEDTSAETVTVNPATFRTVSEIYAADGKVVERGNIENTYYIIFELGGNTYRVYADISDEALRELTSIELEDAEYDKKYQELEGKLEIHKLDNLTEKVPSQKELDKWVGKKGKALLEDGWTADNRFYDLKEMNKMVIRMYKDGLAYNVEFKKGIFKKNYDNVDIYAEDFDIWKIISPLKIASITYDRIGDGVENYTMEEDYQEETTYQENNNQEETYQEDNSQEEHQVDENQQEESYQENNYQEETNPQASE
jgi:hypothetical protein